MKELTQEDYDYSFLVVDDIVEYTDVKDIRVKLENLISDYEGNRRLQFLHHLNGLFFNVCLNQLSWRKSGTEEKAIEARKVTKELKEK